MRPTWRVVITGASRGIGEAVARRLAARGHEVVLVARRADALARISDDIRARGGRAEYHPFSLDSVRAARDFARLLRGQYPRIDALVLNAGISQNLLFEDASLEQIELELEVNYVAPLALLHELLPDMKARGTGRIAGVCSLTAGLPFPGNATYAASKSALFSALRTLRIELRPYGILVGAVLPGFTRTELSRRLESGVPMATLSPEEVARAVEQCLENGLELVVPGLPNRLTLAAFRLFPLSMDWLVSQLAPMLVPGYRQALEHRRG